MLFSSRSLTLTTFLGCAAARLCFVFLTEGLGEACGV
jgi:hypothetical protein